MEGKRSTEEDQPKISFKIGRIGKAATKTNGSSDSEDALHSSSGELALSQEYKLSDESIASTVPPSQEDMFATQMDELSSADDTPPRQSSGSSVGPANYDDFVSASQSQDIHGISLLKSYSASASPKTSTPRKRKPDTIINQGHGLKLQDITEEESVESPKRSKSEVSDETIAEKQHQLFRKLLGSGESLSMPSPRQIKETSPVLNTMPNKQDSPNLVPTSTLSSSVEVIIIDGGQQPNETTNRPSSKTFCSQSRQSLEVVYDSSSSQEGKKPSLLQSTADEYDDSLRFQFSYSPTQNVMPDIKDTNGENTPITIDDDGEQDCLVTYEKEHSVGLPLLPDSPDCQARKSSPFPVKTLDLSKDLDTQIKSDRSLNLPWHDSKSATKLDLLSSIDKVGRLTNQPAIPALSQVKKDDNKIITISEGDTSFTPVGALKSNNLKKISFSFNLKGNCTATYNPLTKEIDSVEVMECVNYTEDSSLISQMLSDVSPGALGDVSDLSKNSSPSSVTSTVPFPLPCPRASITSTVSTSTTSSGSSFGSGSTGSKSVFRAPLVPLSKDRSYFGDNISSNHQNVACKFEKASKLLLLLAETMVSKASGEDCHLPSSPISSDKIVADRPDIEVSVKENGSSLLDLPSIPENVPCEPVADKLIDQNGLTPNTKQSPISLRSNHFEETPKNSTTKKRCTVNPKTTRSRSRKKLEPKPAVDEDTKDSQPSLDAVPEEIKLKTQPSTKNRGQRKGKVLSGKEPDAKPYPVSRRRIFSEELPYHQYKAENLPVFARWTDGKYYSGKILNQTKTGRYNVKFDDGNTKCLSDDVVNIVSELRKGLLVFADYNDTGFESGMIVSMKVVDDVVMYVVELDSNQIISVPRSKIFMTDDQVKILLETEERSPSPAVGVPVKNTFEVAPDNILDGKRNRTLRCNRPGYSGEGTPKHVEEDQPSTDDESGFDREHYPVMSVNCRKQRDVINKVRHVPDKSKIFEGMRFLFTSAANCGPAGFQDRSSDSGGVALAGMPFAKDHLTAQLKAGGGVVCKSFEEVEADTTSCYLISNGPCLTATYILCLANNVPILNHMWVIYSSLNGKKLPINGNLLPAGYSIEQQTFVDQCGGQVRRKKPLARKNILLICRRTTSAFAKLWFQVLVLLGAQVTPLSAKPERAMVEGIHFIVASASLLPDLKDWAQQLGIMAVSVEWVQQCLINWKECKFTSSSE